MSISDVSVAFAHSVLLCVFCLSSVYSLRDAQCERRSGNRMPSDVSIDDFAGDDIASFRQAGSKDSNRNVNASSSMLSLPDFGNLQDNYGWVRCRSRSYPNRVYFYNTNSGCTTWYRPVSRYIDIPFISMSRKVISSDDVTAVDLELMSVSDNEKEPTACNKAVEAGKNIIARCYYAPRAESASDTDETTIVNAQTSDYSYDRKTAEQTFCASDGNNNNNNNNNHDDDSEAKATSLYAANFLETKFFVTEGKVDVESGTLQVFKSPKSDDSENDNDDSSEVSFQPMSSRHSHVVYGVPRLKRINLEHQLIQPTKQSRAVRKKRPQPPPPPPLPRKSSTACDRAPTKIISNMYGVKTISYDLPGPEQIRAQMGVKFSTLTDSDSDDSESPPQRAKVARSFESEWRDIGQKLRPLLLSDSSSSSPSSRSNASNSNSRSSNCTYFTCSTCSSCSTCN